MAMKKGKSITTHILLVFGIVILANLIADRFFLRLDYTADKRYTLSEATKNILGDLKKPVTVTAYFSEELPPDFARLRRDFQDELIEYSNRSGGKVMFDFVNPNKDETAEQKAISEGIQPVLLNVREKDQVKQQKAYMGAVVHYGENKEVIPFIQPGTAMEYALSTSIKKLTVENKPKLGFIQGHGEPAPNSMMQAWQSLSVLYDIEPFSLSDPAVDINKFKTLVWVAPVDSVSPDQCAKLDYFLSNGKNIYIAMNRVQGNFQTGQGTEVRTGLEKWLEGKGLKVIPEFVIDQSCGNVTVNQQQGGMSFQTNMQFPYLPLITKFPESPVTRGLTSVMLQFASPIEYVPMLADVKFTPLATSSERAGIEKLPMSFNIGRNWQAGDFPRSNIVLAGVLSGRLSGNAISKLLLVSDGDFIINGEGQQARQIMPDNLTFFVNGVDWLSDDTGLIDLRAKEVSSRPLDQMESGKKAFIKYLNFLLPLILILGYGLFRYQHRRNLRMKRMNENYI